MDKGIALMSVQHAPTPFLRGGLGLSGDRRSGLPDLLGITAGGTALEFHQLAFRLHWKKGKSPGPTILFTVR
jgi:hypothetical protein